MLTQQSAAAHSRISELAKGASSHAALNNEFYRRWMAGPLSVDQVEITARNFYERVRRTPDRIALAYLHMDDIAARAETVENLSDEMGHGNPEKVHSVLLRRFFETLLSRMRGAAVTFDEVRVDILSSTHKLIEQGNKLFASSIPQEACGALLAQEWHAYPQLVYLYEGVRNYRHYFDLEEFHENCEYFYAHIGATEKEHKTHSLSTAAQMCRNEADLANLERGFTSYLDLLAENWADIGRALETV
jgi:pyrroloquinoline quinone (PQQ) biosynthesis protein C